MSGDMEQVRAIAERYLLPVEVSGTWPWLGLGRSLAPLEAVGVDGSVNVLAGEAPLSGTTATLRAWMLARAEALIAELDEAGWRLAAGSGPSISFRGRVESGIYLLTGQMVKRGTENQIECRVQLHLIWAEMVPEDKQISEEAYRAAWPYRHKPV